MTDDASRQWHPRESALRRVWHAYRVEIMLLLVAVAGLLLIFERSRLRLALESVVRWLGASLLRGADGFLAVLNQFSLSALLGLALVVTAFAVIIWRIRWRAMCNPQLTTIACPFCGGVIHRVHRHLADRMLNWVVPVRRYHCANRECGWCGLRVTAANDAPQPAPTKVTRY